VSVLINTLYTVTLSGRVLIAFLYL